MGAWRRFRTWSSRLDNRWGYIYAGCVTIFGAEMFGSFLAKLVGQLAHEHFAHAVVTLVVPVTVSAWFTARVGSNTQILWRNSRVLKKAKAPR